MQYSKAESKSRVNMTPENIILFFKYTQKHEHEEKFNIWNVWNIKRIPKRPKFELIEADENLVALTDDEYEATE